MNTCIICKTNPARSKYCDDCKPIMTKKYKMAYQAKKLQDPVYRQQRRAYYKKYRGTLVDDYKKNVFGRKARSIMANMGLTPEDNRETYKKITAVPDPTPNQFIQIDGVL